MGLATGLKPVSVDNASVRLKTADGQRTAKYKVIVPPGATDPRIVARCWAEQLHESYVEVSSKIGKDTTASVTYGEFDAVDVVRNWLRETTGDAKADPLPPKAKAS
jgi:hypothetical protein